jgi:hypothetical protein
VASEAERSVAAEVICWERHFSRAPHYACNTLPILTSTKFNNEQIAKSIMSRQSTFLSSTVWKRVPWEDDPASKSAIEYLVDIETDIAQHVVQFETYSSSQSNQELEWPQLTTKIAASLEELNTWWLEWGTEHGLHATEVPAPQAISQPPFHTSLEYDTLWTAFIVCIYDSMRILLLQLWHMLQSFPSLEQTVDRGIVLDMPNGTTLLGITSDIQGLACEIIRSLKYCYDKSRRFISTGSSLFILHVAYGVF